MAIKNLSKSKLLAYRQCPKRLWLEVHRPDLRADSSATQASFSVGHQVGEIAQHIYDPDGKGAVLDPHTEGFEAAFARTQTLLQGQQPIFEASFCAEGALALADVLLPVKKGAQQGWRMVEVKSSTEVKDYHRDDAAVQAFVARAAGLPLHSIALAHVDKTWVYPGGGDYNGLLREEDLTAEAFARGAEVQGWITDAHAVVAQTCEPRISTGKHCRKPYECGFLPYCQAQEPQVEYPIRWLPDQRKKVLLEYINSHGVLDMADVPDDLLNEQQLRVKKATLTNEAYFDKEGAAQALSSHKPPIYFLDFETISYAVPCWKGTRPHQKIPFQFSLHILHQNGTLSHHEFLDVSGHDPSAACAQALISVCGSEGTIFAYHSSFEKMVIKELFISQSGIQAEALRQIHKRIQDLEPIAEKHYYHPSQKGHWSIKDVLPALCPDLNYHELDGVQDGGMAMTAYLEAIAPETSPERKAQIEAELLEYCHLDTYAMVRLWAAFSGSTLKL